MVKKELTSPFKPDTLKGKVAFITGGGSGIGFEIARQFGLHGAKLVLMGRREAPLQAAVQALAQESVEAAAVSGDVRDFEQCSKAIDAAVRRFGHIDILVNNAAGNFLSPAEDLSPNGFKTVIEIDAMGVFNMTHAAFPHLKQTGDAVIINISATLHYGATWYQIHASAAKAAIDSITRSLGLEWSEYGIRTVGIAPGPVGGTAGLTKLSGDASDDALGSVVPLRRVGTKFDIAMAAIFLSSSAGAFISGETVIVDGAAWLNQSFKFDRETVRGISRGVEKKSRETGIPKPKL